MLNNETVNPLAENQTCPAVGYQSASICVPVTVTPFAQTGVTVTKCCGTPVVTPGRETCGGVKNGACFFTISQDICVAVPVEFGAVATVGDRRHLHRLPEAAPCSRTGDPGRGRSPLKPIERRALPPLRPAFDKRSRLLRTLCPQQAAFAVDFRGDYSAM